MTERNKTNGCACDLDTVACLGRGRGTEVDWAAHPSDTLASCPSPASLSCTAVCVPLLVRGFRCFGGTRVPGDLHFLRNFVFYFIFFLFDTYLGLLNI